MTSGGVTHAKVRRRQPPVLPRGPDQYSSLDRQYCYLLLFELDQPRQIFLRSSPWSRKTLALNKEQSVRREPFNSPFFQCDLAHYHTGFVKCLEASILGLTHSYKAVGLERLECTFSGRELLCLKQCACPYHVHSLVSRVCPHLSPPTLHGRISEWAELGSPRREEYGWRLS